MKGFELYFGDWLFIPDILEVLGELLFALEEFVVDDRVDVFKVLHFFYLFFFGIKNID